MSTPLSGAQGCRRLGRWYRTATGPPCLVSRATSLVFPERFFLTQTSAFAAGRDARATATHPGIHPFPSGDSAEPAHRIFWIITESSMQRSEVSASTFMAPPHSRQVSMSMRMAAPRMADRLVRQPGRIIASIADPQPLTIRAPVRGPLEPSLTPTTSGGKPRPDPGVTP